MTRRMMNDQLETLRAEVILGQECDAFFSTDPGRYVKARAMEEVARAIDNIKTVNPADAEKIAKIQIDLKSAENALTWLNEAIFAGRNALQQLKIMANEEEI